MDAAQATPWRALARSARLQGTAPSSDRTSAARVPEEAGARSDERRRRRRGNGLGRLRRAVRLEPIEIPEPEWEDACDSPWYGCGEDGCCVDSEWWSPVMPSRAFLREGLIHMSVTFAAYAFCGETSVPYGVQIYSTDAAREYAQMLAVADDEVTCLTCIVEMGHADFFA